MAVKEMSSHWPQHCFAATGFFLLALIALAWTSAGPKIRLLPKFAAVKGGAKGIVEEKTWPQRKNEEIQRPADFFAHEDRLGYQGYTVERRMRKVFIDDTWIDVAYINLQIKNRLVKTFDADVYFGAGNSADFGFFPFLADGNKQLLISQDRFRGGCQWVVSLSPRLKVLFDGQKLGVGREGPDLRVVDLDDDGTFEILAPVTDFYELNDKMSVSQIPLPTIVFKYDPTAEKYLPANAQFRNYVYEDHEKVAEPDLTLQMEHRSTILNNLLVYIYAGDEQQGWDFYDHNYQPDDKEELRQRVKTILRRQPLYHLIYKRKGVAEPAN